MGEEDWQVVVDMWWSVKVDSIYNKRAKVDGQGVVLEATNSIHSVLEWGWIDYLSTTYYMSMYL